jgi:hypothetical protein
LVFGIFLLAQHRDNGRGDATFKSSGLVGTLPLLWFGSGNIK